MVANPHRRAIVTDAALELLGREGSRVLTHRAVDRAAAVPAGTSANYFPTRAALLLAMARRVFDRLAPDPDRLAKLDRVPRDEATAKYAGYVVERLLAQPDLARALIELRLAASRSAEVFDVLAPFLRDGLRADVDFHRGRGLAGGRSLVLLVHHLVDGIVLDQLTVPLDARGNPVRTTERAVSMLLAQQAQAGRATGLR